MSLVLLKWQPDGGKINPNGMMNKQTRTLTQFLMLFVVLYYLTLSGSFKGQKFGMGLFWGS